MNCAATQHLHAGFYLFYSFLHFISFSPAHTQLFHHLNLKRTHLNCLRKRHCLFRGCTPLFGLLLSGQVTLTNNPPCSLAENWATTNQSRGPTQHGDLSLPTPVARATVCFSAPLLGLDEQSPYWGQVLHSGGNPTPDPLPPHPRTEKGGYYVQTSSLWTLTQSPW